jgi:hypothetical protein
MTNDKNHIVEISEGVRVTVSYLDNGQIHYQLESKLFDRWMSCGQTVEYTNAA